MKAIGYGILATVSFTLIVWTLIHKSVPDEKGKTVVDGLWFLGFLLGTAVTLITWNI